MKKIGLSVLILCVSIFFLFGCGNIQNETDNNEELISDSILDETEINENQDNDVDDEELVKDSTEENQSNDSTWIYYEAAKEPHLLIESKMLSMDSYDTAYTRGFKYMLRGDFEDVESSSLEDWIKVVNKFSDNTFCKEFKRILDETNYYELSQDEKAFLDFYIRFDSFTYTDSQYKDSTLGKVIGDVYVINYNDYATYKMDDGRSVAAPREMIFDIEGMEDWGLTSSKIGLVYFSDLKNPNVHCVYRTVVSNDDWLFDSNNKYISAGGLIVDEENAKNAYDTIGFFYVTDTGAAKPLCKYSGEEYNELIDVYSELIEFMRTFSDEVFLPYLSEVKIKEAQRINAPKAEKQKETYSTGKCPNCGGSGMAKYYYGSSDLEAYLSGHDSYEVRECPMCHGTGE